MREVLEDVDRFRSEGKGVALATVVTVWGSAPRRPGAKMAVSSAGEVAGSVSGGCVEGAVVEQAGEVLAAGVPRLLRFGVSDDEAWAVGLSCGGEIAVWLEPLAGGATEVEGELRRHLEADELAAVATVVSGPGLGAHRLTSPGRPARGSLGSAELDRWADARAAEGFASFDSALHTCEGFGEEAVEVFVDVHPPRPKLVLVGAVHAAIPLVAFARALGFRTFVVDPRGTFASPERFPHAEGLLREWPDEALPRIGLDEATYVACLTHDFKIDVPALVLALRSPARYVGVLGSKRTHAKRVAALREAGLSEAEIGRIHAPIGLDLGGRRPEEIALSIAAEIVAASHGRGVGRAVA